MNRIPIIITAALIFSACGTRSGDFSKVDGQAKDLYAFTQGLTEDGTRLGNMIFDTVDGKNAIGDPARKELERLQRKCRDKARELSKPVP
jgi:hypothetical protein